MPWLIWGLSALFYLYTYTLRVFPSCAPKLIMQSVALHSTGFGLAMAFYFYLYAPLQIPSGLALDLGGPRRWLTLSSLSCALGCTLFAYADSFFLASTARLLMGAGSACSFVSFIYLAAHLFSPQKLSFLTGLGNAMGTLGAALGQGPMRFAIEAYGFQTSLLTLSLIGTVFALLIFFVVPSSSSNHTLSLREDLKLVCARPQSWINGLCSLLFFCTVPGCIGLWAPAFIHEAYGLPLSLAASACSLFFVGLFIGSLLLPVFKTWIGSQKKVVIFFPLLAAFFLSLLIYLPRPNSWWPSTCLFLTGLFLAGQTFHYTLGMKLNPTKVSATAVALTNALTYMGAAIAQPLVGLILDANWKGDLINGVHHYTTGNFQMALSIFPVALLLASLCSSLFLKE